MFLSVFKEDCLLDSCFQVLINLPDFQLIIFNTELSKLFLYDSFGSAEIAEKVAVLLGFPLPLISLPLPLIRSYILEGIVETEADFFVFSTGADIGVAEFFYLPG